MANWCSTYVTLNCKTKEDAKYVYDKINDWVSYSHVPNHFDEVWLGNVLINSGLYTKEDIDNNPHPRCRGSIVYLDLNDEQVIVDTETAWFPMLQIWQEVCDKCLKDKEIEIIYNAEECGCGIYYSNDPAVVGTYQFDGNWDLSEEDVRNILLEYLPEGARKWHDHDDIYSLADICENMDEDVPSIHQFEYVPISELD